MLAIRFARVGKTKQPSYRLVVSEKGRDLYGKSLEILGNFNPRTDVSQINAERVKYWISVGAQPSARVYNFLVDQNVIPGPKLKISRAKKKKGEEAKAAPAAPKAEAAAAPAEKKAPEAKAEATDSKK
ncbi:MAG: 30S ribosomal protein S16 [Patescibacteria group bacterium]|nr:30S ribosomal protein S16 [Patescibacteria group bacterium]